MCWCFICGSVPLTGPGLEQSAFGPTGVTKGGVVRPWRARAGALDSGRADGPDHSATGSGGEGEWTWRWSGPHPCPQALIERLVGQTMCWVPVEEKADPALGDIGLRGGGRESLCRARKRSLMASPLRASLAWRLWRWTAPSSPVSALICRGEETRGREGRRRTVEGRCRSRRKELHTATPAAAGTRTGIKEGG